MSHSIIYLGMDVHKESITIAVLPAAAAPTRVERLSSDLGKLRRFLDRLAEDGELHACYEASGAGYVLHRALRAWGYACEVIAPSLIPIQPRVQRKHDKRNAVQLARLYRAGELTVVRIPSEAEVFETLDGQCRLMPPLTRALTASAPRWARAVLPVAQQVAQQLLRDAQAQSETRPTGTVRRIRPQLRAARDFAPRLDKHEDPRYQGKSVTQRQRTVEQVQRANRRWERNAKPGMTRQHYVRTVVPALASVKLSDLMVATGLTNASCSKIRRGLTVPHPRHWEALGSLA